MLLVAGRGQQRRRSFASSGGQEVKAKSENTSSETDNRQTTDRPNSNKVKKRETMGDLFQLQRPMLFGDIYDEEEEDDDGDERVTSGRNSHFDRFDLREDGAPDEETKRLPLQTYRPIRVG